MSLSYSKLNKNIKRVFINNKNQQIQIFPGANNEICLELHLRFSNDFKRVLLEQFLRYGVTEELTNYVEDKYNCLLRIVC